MEFFLATALIRLESCCKQFGCAVSIFVWLQLVVWESWVLFGCGFVCPANHITTEDGVVRKVTDHLQFDENFSGSEKYFTALTFVYCDM